MHDLTCPPKLLLAMDEADRAELERYMRFVATTDQCPDMGVAAHAVSLIAFALEWHEEFQQWCSAEGRQP